MCFDSNFANLDKRKNDLEDSGCHRKQLLGVGNFEQSVLVRFDNYML